MFGRKQFCCKCLSFWSPKLSKYHCCISDHHHNYWYCHRQFILVTIISTAKSSSPTFWSKYINLILLSTLLIPMLITIIVIVCIIIITIYLINIITLISSYWNNHHYHRQSIQPNKLFFSLAYKTFLLFSFRKIHPENFGKRSPFSSIRFVMIWINGSKEFSTTTITALSTILPSIPYHNRKGGLCACLSVCPYTPSRKW